MIKIKNLTPHSIVLMSPEGVSTTILPEAVSARVKNKPGCAAVDAPFGECYDYTKDVAGDIEGLPDAEGEEGVILVVSGVVGAALTEKGIYRRDVRVPGTGPDDEAVREPALLADGAKNPRGGQIKAVTRLKRIC